MCPKVAILQEGIPHYRSEFFALLRQKLGGVALYVYSSPENMRKNGFHVEGQEVQHIPNLFFHEILLYSPFPFLKKEYDTLILPMQFSHITTWLLLMTRAVHKKKIILWGQSVSVKRYLREERKLDRKLGRMIAMADGVYFYTQKEYNLWRPHFPEKKMVALQNTLTGAKEMAEYRSPKTREELKGEYGICQKTVLIFCARFETEYRRTDLLEAAIQGLDPRRFGFIIVGAGRYKPDFSPYPNVYDFGAVYDTQRKRELFTIADLYFQPGWVGLSIVEAMAYGKPVCTFVRSPETLQCVEYSYITHGENGLIFRDLADCLSGLEALSPDEIHRMGEAAREQVRRELLPEMMADRAVELLKEL